MYNQGDNRCPSLRKKIGSAKPKHAACSQQYPVGRAGQCHCHQQLQSCYPGCGWSDGTHRSTPRFQQVLSLHHGRPSLTHTIVGQHLGVCAVDFSSAPAFTVLASRKIARAHAALPVRSAGWRLYLPAWWSAESCGSMDDRREAWLYICGEYSAASGTKLG